MQILDQEGMPFWRRPVVAGGRGRRSRLQRFSELRIRSCVLVGASVGGAMSLFMGIVPSETVPARMVATAVALVIGVAEIIGGVTGPTLAGMAADHWGLRAPMWITAGCLVVAIAAASAMQETAPRALARRRAGAAQRALNPSG